MMGRVWAVAVNTVAQALRMKVAVVVIFLLIVLLPVMSSLTTGDDTLVGKLQTFSSYGLSLTSLMLCLLTIVISTYSITNDLKNRYLHMIICKPIHRYQLFLGKLLGVLILNGFLLLIFAGIIYCLTLQMPRFSKADPEQMRQAQTEFLTTRISLEDKADKEVITQRAMEEYSRLEKVDRLPEEMEKSEIMMTLIKEELAKDRSVEMGTRKIWKFDNISLTDPNDGIYIKFKLRAATIPPDEKIRGVWLIGDLRQEQFGSNQWKTRVFRADRADEVGTYREFNVPAEALAPDGHLEVAFFNPFVNQTTVIPEDVQVLYKVDTFFMNFTRAIIMLYARLIFLAALGAFLSVWLSFPTCILISLIVYFIATTSGFIAESVEYFGENPNVIYTAIMNSIIQLLPRFDGTHSPTTYIVSADLIKWSFLGQVYGVLVCLKSMLLLLFGILIFNKKEVAKVII